jgi:hypothetical protein
MGGQEKRLVSHKRFLEPLVSQAWGETVSDQLLGLPAYPHVTLRVTHLVSSD